MEPSIENALASEIILLILINPKFIRLILQRLASQLVMF